MKAKWLTGCILLAGAMTLRTQTNDLSAALQRGLFEEEANRNLDAAVSNYQALAAQFDQDRPVAATAIFRLGECYRKLGRTNDAVVQYQRIFRDFADQPTLVSLSQQNLNALHAVVPPRWIAGPQLPAPGGTFQERLQAIIAKAPPASGAATSTDSAAKAAELEAEAAQLKAQVEQLLGLKREERLVEVQQNYSNPVLTKLMQDLTDAEQKFAVLTNDYSSHDLHVTRVTAQIGAINGQIDTQVNGVIQGLQAKMDADLDAAKVLRAQAGSAPSARPADVTDDEAKEIQRIQQMIQNSPDLINAERGDTAPLYAAAGKGQLRVAGFLLDHGANIEGVNQHVPLIAASINGNRAIVELLLSRGADVNAKGNAGDTALHQAALHGYQAVAEVLVANHADVNAPDAGGSTPLFSAASSGQLKIVQMLLAAGANSNLKDRQGRSPLNYAIGNSPEILKALLAAGTNPNTEDSDGRAPLSYAVERNFPLLVKLLLDAKADPNGGKKDNNGRGALHYAIANDSPEIVQALSGAGVDVNGEDSFGRTPLSYAAERNDPIIVKLLLDAKADPNGGKLDAPIFRAIKLGNTNILELLLQARANPNAKGAINWDIEIDGATIGGGGHPSVTPLFLAVSTKQLPMVQLLLKFKADPNDSQTDGRSLLFSALADPEILGVLLDAGGKVDTHLSGGMTLLDQAVNVGFPAATAEVLLKHGADPNLRDSRGNAPLHYSTWNSTDRNKIELLLDHGADPNVRNDDGQTPLDNIKMRLKQNPTPSEKTSLDAIADLLRRHGALDNLPHWDRISVSRPSTGYSQTIFEKGTNDWNRFTLLETLLQLYREQSPRFPQFGGGNASETALPFPDLARLTIIRHQPGTTNETRIKVNLLNATNGIDYTRNLVLEFGDVVEVPEREHALGDPPAGLTGSQRDFIINALNGNVQLVVRGAKVELPVHPTDSSLIGSVLNRPEAQSLLLSSSDLSRVKVIRADPVTGKKREWVLDCSRMSRPQNNPFPPVQMNDPRYNAPGFRLRDGDVIEVPEKQN